MSPERIDTPEARLIEQLRTGLTALSATADAEAPDTAALLSLVVRVRREQRRVLARELAQFLACALVIVGGGLLLLAKRPVYYLALQGLLVLPVALGMLLRAGARKRVTE